VLLWLVVLSDQLRVVGLVGLYPTNYLMRRGPIPKRRSFGHPPEPVSTWGISQGFPWFSPA
jgi:hypothetical protein